MSSLAPTLEGFFTDRLMLQRHANPNTVAAYRDTFRLLLSYLRVATGKLPCKLDLQDLDAHTVAAFLQHLEIMRHNGVRTRNARLSAIHSFFQYAALLHPEHAELIQRVLAIPEKRFDTALVSHLTPPEIEGLLASPRPFDLDRTAGLHASVVGRADPSPRFRAGRAAPSRRGVGRRRARSMPWQGQKGALHAHHQGNRRGGPGVDAQQRWTDRRPAFAKPWHRPSSDSRRHLAHCRQPCRYSQPELPIPCRLTRRTARAPPHRRHEPAPCWRRLGNHRALARHQSIESTNIYLHADMALKERALARTSPPGVLAGRYRASDELLAFLDHL
jgi:integrase/recombinase XerD